MLLVAADLLALGAALLISVRLSWSEYLVWFCILGGAWLVAANVFDAYDIDVAGQVSSGGWAAARASVAAVVTVVGFAYLVPGSYAGLSAVLLLTLAGVGLLAWRAFYAVVLTRPAFRRRVLILGAGRSARLVADALTEHGSSAYVLVGAVETESPDARRDPDATRGPHLRALAEPRTLPEIVAEHDITTVIVAAHSNDDEVLRALVACAAAGVEIVPMPFIFEQLTGRVPVDHVSNAWTIAGAIRRPGSGVSHLAKRVGDLVLASVGITCLAPLLPLVALAIYLDSPGPIFYTQPRVGRAGRPFQAFKLRSMVRDAEVDGPVWAEENDPRVTRVGRILRKTHLDEMPQLLNVIRGEMSAVGPRPERPVFAADLEREFPLYPARHSVKPGMAGWALVNYGYGASTEDALVKLQYDLYYVKHQSLWFDLIILFKAVVETVTLSGR